MKTVDMHCDTIAELYYSRRDGAPLALRESRLEVDVDKLKKGDALLQNFALFIRLSRVDHPYEYCLKLADVFFDELKNNADTLVQVKSFADIEAARAKGLISALLTVEEGEACEGDADKLRTLYDLGARMMTLTWNYENSLAFPNTRMEGDRYRAFYNTERGLKPLGVEIAREMQRLGIIIDVSHLSDKGFWDVCENTAAPFVASHSNARAVCSHPRNLTDGMIKALAERGGVMGINYYGAFLRDNNPDEQSRILDMLAHIRHIKNVGGIGCIGLGSDFDGISGDLEMKNCAETGKLAEAMLRGGFSEDEVEAVFYKNVLRLYKEVLR